MAKPITKYDSFARFTVDGLGTFTVMVVEWNAHISQIRYVGHEGKALFGDSRPWVPTADLMEV